MPPRGEERKRVIIEGRVQGVGFRFFTRDLAVALALKGTVRNLPGGEAVEVVVQGQPHSIERLIAALRKGPPGAAVTRLQATDEAADARLRSFEITR